VSYMCDSPLLIIYTCEKAQMRLKLCAAEHEPHMHRTNCVYTSRCGMLPCRQPCVAEGEGKHKGKGTFQVVTVLT
jgi:hypothetical protein